MKKQGILAVAVVVGCWCGRALAVTPGADAPLVYGELQARAGRPIPLHWTVPGGVAAKGEVALRLEPGPKDKGVLLSAPLPLRPLVLYDLAVELRRGPGTVIGTRLVFKEANGAEGQRLFAFQLPDVARPNWIPLSAHRQPYVTGFCLPEGASEPRLEFSIEGKPGSVWNYLDLYALKLKEGPAVRLGSQLGPDLLGWGSFERLDKDGVPPGCQWIGLHSKTEAAVTPEGEHFLRLHATHGWPILAAAGVPVRRGRAYQLSMRARGQGTITLTAQVMSDESAYGERVGDAQPRGYTVTNGTWTSFSQLWFAEAMHVHFADVYLQVTTDSALDITAVRFCEVLPSGTWPPKNHRRKTGAPPVD